MTRSVADIGAGLAPARSAHPIAASERLHVIGVAGAGASAAALLAHRAGARVTGCDAGGPSPYSDAVADAGIDVQWEHAASHVTAGSPGADVPSVDRVAVTKALTSVQPDHPELVAARRSGVPVEAWQQVVADVAATAGQRLVTVAGTHGKSTSAGWLLHVLVEAGRDPSAFVGALLPSALTGGLPATARWGAGDTFVVEADEYAGNFDPFQGVMSMILNAEWDHPDVFADEDSVLSAFEDWLRAADVSRLHGEEPRTVILNVGDQGATRLAARVRSRLPEIRLISVALAGSEAGWAPGPTPDVVGSVGTATDRGPGPSVEGVVPAGVRTTLHVEGIPGWPGPVSLRLGGRHNATNALCVAAAARELGLPGDVIAAGIGSFPGVGRRMESKGEPRGVAVLDDYAHHPTAIAASLAAVRERFPGRRVWGVYEPLTFHRTAHMLDAFAAVLAGADRAVIADIWAGRDPDTSISSAKALADAVTRLSGEPATAPGSVERTADHLAERVMPGDVVLVMGGGRSYVIAERLVAILAGSSGPGR